MVLTGVTWRSCWAFFAGASALAPVTNRAALRDVDRDPGEGSQKGWRDLLHLSAAPLFVIAFVYGTVSAIYVSFAADHMLEAGGVPGIPQAATPAMVFILYGLFGLGGLLTGGVRDAIGVAWLLRLLMLAGAASVALVAVLPAHWGGLMLSAALQGLHVMMTSAVLAFWSERLFPALPSLSLTAALLATAAGSVIGPAVAGLVSGAAGPGAMFLGTAALPTATALLLRAHHAQVQPVDPGGAVRA